MSKGVLIFAYNSKIDYVKIATIAAALVHKHLDLPVTLVTDIDHNLDGCFDQIVRQPLEGKSYERIFKFGGITEKVEWHNQNRASAYELSPYDQTLLLDADYLQFNGHLKYLFDTNLDISCYNKVHDISNWSGLQDDAHVGFPGIPMQWATALYFTKSPRARAVFEMMESIKRNYAYYATLYNFGTELFRNDYTLSIALQIMTGYSQSNFTAIPGSLISANTGIELLEARPNGELVFVWKYAETHRVTKIRNTNVHIMNKKTITDPDILEQLKVLAQ